MYLLKKLFHARTKVAESRSKWDDVEKPFLDHLEDLRKMLFKVVLTLAVTMTLSFIFDKELLEIVRYPVKMAGLDAIDGSKLPDGIAESDWGKVKEMSRAYGTLAPDARPHFLQRVGDKLRPAVVATYGFRAALVLPMDQREGFLAAIISDPAALDLARFLARNNPDAHLDDNGQLLRMTALGPAESFTLSLKLAFFAGIVVAFPLLLWYLAEFIVPGLNKKERKLLLPSVLVGFALFLIGVCFAYFVVAPRALRFFYEYSLRLGVISDWRIGYFVSFVTQFTVIFGLCFELPVVVMALVKLGLLAYETMARTRAYAIVAIFVIAAIITPTTDALTMVLLAGPMVLLYEICIWLAYLIERRERKQAADDESAWQERMLVPAVAAVDGVEDPEPGAESFDEPVEVTAAAGAQPMIDPDEDLPPEWGAESDPYAADAWARTRGPNGDDATDDALSADEGPAPTDDEEEDALSPAEDGALPAEDGTAPPTAKGDAPRP